MHFYVAIGEKQNLALGNFSAAVPGECGAPRRGREANITYAMALGNLPRAIGGGVVHHDDLIRPGVRSQQGFEAGT
jgi:hypothetical protein